MGELKAIGSLIGTISPNESLKGILSGASSGSDYETYTGEYAVTPKPFETQILRTANKVAVKDITVEKIPFEEVANPSNGLTAYIGG